ncbi:MAG: shikimate kinase [Patescibacteria group bacterium]|nr:shikimate kinase [Patescibacteria group bacterium]
MKKLIIIRGPLGVGKSTVSKILSKKIQAEYISLDKVLEDNDLDSKGGIPLENFLKANEIIRDLGAKSTKTVVLDGCFYYQEQIDDLMAKFDGDAAIFTLMSGVETCIQRDLKREKVYGEDATRFVYAITARISSGYQIDNSNLSAEKTVEKIMEKL